MLASLLFHRGEYQSMYQSMTYVVHVLFSFAREYFRNIRLPKPMGAKTEPILFRNGNIRVKRARADTP
jgi:hypothetical protein